MDKTVSRRSFLAGCAGSALALDLLPAQDPTTRKRELAWTDVGGWRIEGRAFAERTAPFDRLPAAAAAVVRKEVWDLSRHSAGMAVRFRTAARELHVRYRLTKDTLAMPHMPATGVSGVDLYSRPKPGAPLRWVEVARPTQRDVEARLAQNPEGSAREWLLYLPLYNGVEKLELGTPPGSELTPHAPPSGQPIVVYGTSIAHGACASRPGMAWPAIVGRKLEREVVNLGFSGNGRMEAEVGRFLCELDPAVFVVDCLPNMTPALVAERTQPLVRQLRGARPKTPILLVEDRTFGNAWIGAERLAAHAKRRQALRDAFAALQRDRVEAVHLLAGERLLGDDDEGTTDGSHPNDLGMMRQAEIVAATLQALL